MLLPGTLRELPGQDQLREGRAEPASQEPGMLPQKMQSLLHTFFPIAKPQGTQAAARGTTGLCKYLRE